MHKIPEIIKKYRKENKLTQEAFAARLIDGLPGATLGKQAVNLWECGKTKPLFGFMIAVQLTYNDWRSEMACEVINVLRPDPAIKSVVSKGNDGVLKKL